MATTSRETVPPLKHRPLAVRQSDAARLCGVSARTFADWLAAPDAPPTVRRGGVVLVPVRELRQWLTRQATGGQP